ncbi:MAG: hypothetical protein ACLFMO_08155 [Eubacteriales bacterium]
MKRTNYAKKIMKKIANDNDFLRFHKWGSPYRRAYMKYKKNPTQENYNKLYEIFSYLLLDYLKLNDKNK